MAVVTPPRSPLETTRAPDVPEVLFREARRRRRRRWMAVIAVVVLCASGVSLGVTLSRSGSGGGAGRGASPRSAGPAPATLGAAAGSGAELAGGHWTTLMRPHPGVERAWDLTAWTGKYVIAWGSTNPCCRPIRGSSEHGAAFDPASRSWRSIPPAPVDVTVESTIWTGRQVLVWGSAPPAAQRATRDTLLGFDPATWRWQRLATPPIAPRSAAEVLWGGARLIVIGGYDRSTGVLLNGATYDPQANRWSALPAVPRFAAGAGSKEEPVDVTAAWAAGTLYVWVTHQVSQACGGGCGEISAEVQALRWSPGTSQWHPGPTPPKGVAVSGATAVSMGRYIAVLDGSSCLPDDDCVAGLGGTFALLDVKADRWSSIAANAVLSSAGSFVWTGRAMVAVSPYLTAAGYLLGGYAAALDPTSDSWAAVPELPVPAAPPSGPVLSGTVWTGSELIVSGLVLVPGHRSPTTGPSTVPSCPPITFPESGCGPAPGPGNGSGPDGSCLGTEMAPPCGPGMVAGRYYAYTLITTCTNDYVDGRWWKNELPGPEGSGPMDVWVSVNESGMGGGWMGPNMSVGFEPSAATTCS